MKYLGTVSDPKDLATKEYVDNHSGGGGNGGVIVSDTEPTGDATMLWVDTSSDGIAKYWNGTAWTPISSKASVSDETLYH